MSETTASPRPKRQRASRKNQPLRHTCPYDGCGKRYSRAEHLKRHSLNHSPENRYHCRVPGCHNSFVRLDLFERHKCKHDETAKDRSTSPRGDHGLRRRATESTLTRGQLNGEQVFLTGEAVSDDSHTGLPNDSQWPLQARDGYLSPPSALPAAGAFPPQAPALASAPSVPDDHWLNAPGPSGNGQGPNAPLVDQPNDNFAAWLFDSPDSHNLDFNWESMPFLDFGLDYAANDNTVDGLAGYESSLTGQRKQSIGSPASGQRPKPPDGEPHLKFSEEKRHGTVGILSSFMWRKRPRYDGCNRTGSVLASSENGLWPNVTSVLLENFIDAFWRHVAPSIPIIHQPTFCCNDREPLLLLAMVALGAAAVVASKPKGTYPDYRALSDFIATNLRWEIAPHDDAQPPVALWVGQALLLLELYEKMYSTRQLHERAHIHHASTLTLLRRGNPMVGRQGSETPPTEAPTRAASPERHSDRPDASQPPSNWSWWKRWVSNESMNRVVFAAFQMDTLHACIFGHSADLLPHELRLPLPCDESMWAARSANEVRRLESTFAMYRIKQPNFLDGLKRCLHGYEVMTHHLARLVLMFGLSSIGLHINRREKQVQFVESAPSLQEQARWRSLLLKAFDHWRRSFDEVLSPHHPRGTHVPVQDATSPSVLFHLAHLTMHVDIIDCQILSGSHRLVSRKVSDSDRASVGQRMRVWAETAMARHAALHAFKILHMAFSGGDGTASAGNPAAGFTCRNPSFTYLPWILYISSLTVWAYQFASGNQSSSTMNQIPPDASPPAFDLACKYVNACVRVSDANQLPSLTSKEGCAAVLRALAHDFSCAESEILLEAANRLQECHGMLTGVSLDLWSG